MKGLPSTPGDYVHFKSQVPLHKISIGSKLWRYYDFGPKTVPPLICLPGIAGTADVYYKQIMSLSMKGYRVISLDIPRVWDHLEWVHAFEKFLDTVNVHHVHLYGTSLGGFLAQLFAQHRPRRVKSLVLSNTFLDTKMFSTSMPWSPLVGWTPAFLLKRYILTGIRDDPQDPFIADSVDFVVAQIETFSREDLSSRLTLNAAAATVGSLLLSDSVITIMDTNDYCAIPQSLKDQVSERYPGARRATMKTGGDFPFLSRPDEVNLYLQLHLRRVGVEAKVNNILGVSKDGSTGSMYDDKGNRHGDHPPDGGQGSSGSHHGHDGTQPSSSNGRRDDGEGVEPDVSHSESQGSSTSLASCLEPLPSDSETKLEFEFFTLANINALAFGVIHFLVQDLTTLFVVHLNLGKLYITKAAHLSMANHMSGQLIR